MSRTKLVDGERLPLTPSEEAEADARDAAAAAAKPARDAAQALFNQASAVFGSMEKWEQIFWRPFREEIGDMILAGDVAGIREVLEQMPTLYPGAEDRRQEFLRLLPPR